jgi:ABC-type phosphate/phosphonate transport system substrate-binding protein
LLVVLWLLGLTTAHAADDVLVFGVPPTQSVEQAQKLYGPLAVYLSQATGKKFELQPPRNFLEYSSNMRKAKYDFVFDGPHFVSWRMKNQDHIPLARLPGALIFAVAVQQGAAITEMDNLVAKRICGVSSPNLATLSIIDQFPNPSRQPILLPVRSFGEALDCVKTGKAEAGIMPVKFYNKFKKAGKAEGMRVLFTTKKRPLPARTFSVSGKVDAETRSKLQSALLEAGDKPGAQPLLNRFKAKNLIPVKAEEYKDVYTLLDPVWGFNQ